MGPEESICKSDKVKKSLGVIKSEVFLWMPPLGFSMGGGGGWEAEVAGHRGLRCHPRRGIIAGHHK